LCSRHIPVGHGDDPYIPELGEMTRVAHRNTTGSHKPNLAAIQNPFSRVGDLYGYPDPPPLRHPLGWI